MRRSPREPLIYIYIYSGKNRGLKRGTNYHNNSVNNAKKFYYKTFHDELLLVTQTSFFFPFYRG